MTLCHPLYIRLNTPPLPHDAPGAVGIVEATKSDQYIDAYCDPDDNREHVWFYWMAGASGAILPFSLFGTAALWLIFTLLKEEEVSFKQRSVAICCSVDSELIVALCRIEHTDGMEMESKGKKSEEKTQMTSAEEKEQASEERVDIVQGEGIVNMKHASLQVFTCGAATAVASTLLLFSLALLCCE